LDYQLNEQERERWFQIGMDGYIKKKPLNDVAIKKSLQKDQYFRVR